MGCNHVDLHIRNGAAAPPEWMADIAAGNLLYASPEPNGCYMPVVGNGYLATVATWGALYVAGLYNGACGSTRKARLPSPVALSFASGGVAGAVTAGGLDMSRGVYVRRWAVGGGQIEVRVWAHRQRRHVIVTDVRLLVGPPGGDPLAVNITTLFDPASQATDGPGAGCAGDFTKDFSFSAPVGAAPTVYRAVTTVASDDGEYFNVSIATDALPAMPVQLTAETPTFRVLTTVATSLDFPAGVGTSDAVAALASAEYAAAVALPADALFDEHVAAWAALRVTGIDIAPLSSSVGDIARALDVATHANSSRYYILSSLRDDVFTSVSPGGLGTANYQGAIFMDAEWWVMPSLLLMHPNIAASMLQYRFESLPVMRRLATLFGYGAYGGAMAAWTAAHDGHPFGCCSGPGGEYEDCLEHHVTGDIAFAAWQFYSATHNDTWLATVGAPLLSALADFHLARVTPAPPSSGTAVAAEYHVRGVLPVDEWCVDSGCGCETPGVDDDAQMNAVTRASLLLAARAAAALHNESARSALWLAVGSGVSPLFNTTDNHHDQFTSPSCPSGWGGTHYGERHTVCPEDVLLLTYPLGPFLNVTADVSRRDAELFAPLTCRENAGMTTPIHTIVWLALGNVTAAQAAFNRSLHAAAYGPFHVRNEVDRHPDVIGASFDNTHFVTGDGGFLQALLNGWGGLRIVDDGLQLLSPTLPESVGHLTLRALSWRGAHMTLEVTPTSHVVAVLDAPQPTAACFALVDGAGATRPLVVGGAPLVLDRGSYAYPGLLVEC